MVPVVKKKALVDLLGLTCKLGYLLFVPKKKKHENQLIEGPLLRKASLQQKKQVQKNSKHGKSSQKSKGPSSRVPAGVKSCEV